MFDGVMGAHQLSAIKSIFQLSQKGYDSAKMPILTHNGDRQKNPFRSLRKSIGNRKSTPS
jgi:hypothetical protein